LLKPLKIIAGGCGVLACETRVVIERLTRNNLIHAHRVNQRSITCAVGALTARAYNPVTLPRQFNDILMALKATRLFSSHTVFAPAERTNIEIRVRFVAIIMVDNVRENTQGDAPVLTSALHLTSCTAFND